MPNDRSANGLSLNDKFSQFASWSADLLGSAGAFVFSTLLTLAWALSGPLFNYSDTWQLIINTATTVLTFLAVFLIQHTQNREGRAVQLKLDELIRVSTSARNRLIDLEHCTDDEIKTMQAEFKSLVEARSGRAAKAAPEKERKLQANPLERIARKARNIRQRRVRTSRSDRTE